MSSLSEVPALVAASPDAGDAAHTGAWSRFASADRDTLSAELWLELTCADIRTARVGFLLLYAEDGRADGTSWPAGSGASNATRELAERLLSEKTGLIAELLPDAEAEPGSMLAGARYALGLPVLVGGEVNGCACIEIATDDEALVQAAMGRLQWSVAVLESGLYHASLGHARDQVDNLRNVLQLFAELLATPRFQQAGMQLVTRLVELTGCEKVSFGLVRGRRVRIESVSHSAQHETKMAVLRRIENAMHEALMQRKSVLCERGAEPSALITREHELLLDDEELAGVLSVPLYDGDDYYGALCFERAGQERFTPQQVELAESMAQIGGLLLKRMRLETANIFSKNLTALGALAGGILGPRFLARKLVALLLIGVVIFFSVADGEYWEAGDAVLEGEVKRTLVVPFNGFVDTASHKAGDAVKTGELLATLLDKDLVLERLQLVSERNQITNQYFDAVGRHENVEVQIAKARLDQVEAQLKVVELNLERTRIRAPFDGVIIEGDLSQLLGSAVTKGDSLFIISPLDRYRVAILVDERRINEIAVGQRAVLVLNAEPERRRELQISRITPEVQVVEGGSFYRVEGMLQEPPSNLRPGLEGITKIYVDERKLIGIWTRGLREWLKINLWALFP